MSKGPNGYKDEDGYIVQEVDRTPGLGRDLGEFDKNYLKNTIKFISEQDPEFEEMGFEPEYAVAQSGRFAVWCIRCKRGHLYYISTEYDSTPMVHHFIPRLKTSPQPFDWKTPIVFMKDVVGTKADVAEMIYDIEDANERHMKLFRRTL